MALVSASCRVDITVQPSTVMTGGRREGHLHCASVWNRCVIAASSLFVLFMHGPVASAQGVAQSSERPPAKWTFEVHANGFTGSVPAQGSGGLPAAGEAFTTASGGRASRKVTSWLLGDGAALLNEVLAAAGQAARVSPIDSLLTDSAIAHQVSAGMGVRLSRPINSRVSYDFELEFNPASMRLRGDALSAIETTRTTFEGAMGTALNSPTVIVNPVVTATTSIRERGSARVLIANAVRLQLGSPTRRLRPFVRLGGGLACVVNDGPSVLIVGDYRFTSAPSLQSRDFHETDQALVRYQSPAASPVGILGGGFEYDLGANRGIRFDASLQLGGSRVDTILSATPSRQVTPPPGVIVSLPSNPSIQFITTNQLNANQTPLFPWSLADATQEFRTRKGGSFARALVISTGYFFRF